MAKILGVMGSPRKNGNTHVLVEEILAGAREKGAETEIIMLGELKIKECDGCHLCWQGQPCSKDDDMPGLYQKIAESDVIIFGTPVYWYGPTALMKGFIDRFVYFNSEANRPHIRGKAAVFVVPCEENTSGAADLVAAFFEKSISYLEMQLLGKIIVPGVTARGEVIKQTKVMAEARALGNRAALFYKG